MNLKGQPKSNNFVDRTTTLIPPAPFRDLNTDLFFRAVRQSYDTSLSHQTDPGPRRPVISFKDLTEDEKTLVEDHGFTPEDILLMRTFKTSPGQVMQGWNFQR